MKIKYIALAASLSMIASCSSVDTTKVFDNQQAANMIQQIHTAHPMKQWILVVLPNNKNWEKIDLSYGNVGSPIMLVPQGESEKHWTESVRTRMRDYQNFPNTTPGSFANMQIEFAKQNCSRSQGHIVTETSSYAIYRVEMSGCQFEPDQIQIGKTIKGEDAVYLVSYAAAPNAVSDETFNRMSSVIKEARLVTRKSLTAHG